MLTQFAEKKCSGECVAENQKRQASSLSVACLVAGTCIGGGMLALPVTTGISGFFPSVLVMILCWIAMTASGLFLLEASLWMEEGAHIISISKRFLGNGGRSIAWVLYLFICYASVVAYTAGGGAQVAHSLKGFFAVDLSQSFGCALFLLVFGSALFLGNIFIGRINAILFLAMMGAYLALVVSGIDRVNISYLTQKQWSTAWLATPFLLTSFSFQTLVPSLRPMLKSDAKLLRLAIVGGTSTALVIYLLWEWLILGMIPVEGEFGLIGALEKGEAVTHYMKEQVGGNSIFFIAEYFAFFALITSFLGIAMGLFDFLSDGLKISKNFRGKVVITLLIALPTLFFSTNFERVFLTALDTSGGFGDSILNGIMPVAMVWIGRYRMKLSRENSTPGGKTSLIFVALFFIATFFLELYIHLGPILFKGVTCLSC